MDYQRVCDEGCTIYVDADISFEKMLEGIKQVSGGSIHLSTVSTPNDIDILVDLSNDFDEIGRRDFPDGFVHFRYYLTVFTHSGICSESKGKELFDIVAKLLEYLWSLGFRAVASCNYEDQLPEKGGYSWEGNRWKGD